MGKIEDLPTFQNISEEILREIEGELMPLMYKVDQEARNRLEILEKQMTKKDPIPNPMDTYETYKHKDMIRRAAEEIVLQEIMHLKR